MAGGRATPTESIHLTLEFLGNVEPERVPLVERIAGEVRAGPFRVVLDRIGSFRRARVAWAGSAACSGCDRRRRDVAAQLLGAMTRLDTHLRQQRALGGYTTSTTSSFSAAKSLSTSCTISLSSLGLKLPPFGEPFQQ